MNLMKFMKIGIIVLTMCMVIGNIAYAYDYSATITTLDGQAGDTTLNSKAQSIVGAIIAVTRIIAVGVAIVMLLTIAMKYMMAAPGDRADIKKHAVVYVVGAIVLFAASGILQIIQSFAKNIK